MLKKQGIKCKTNIEMSSKTKFILVKEHNIG